MLSILKKILFLLLIISRVCFADNCSTFTEIPKLKPAKNEPELLIFVSFNMPKQSLKLLAEQANRVNGKLLLRGFVDNSLQATADKTLETLGKEAVGEFLIDPESFEKFDIKVVPAVVIAQPHTSLEETCPTSSFDVVYGDTPLEEALIKIAKQGSLEGQKVAKDFLSKYRAAGG